MGFALRLEEIVKGADLRFIVGPSQNGRRAGPPELSVGGVAEAERSKHRAYFRGFFARNTLIPPGRARPEWEPAKTDAAFLSALDEDRRRPDLRIISRVEFGVENRVRREFQDFDIYLAADRAILDPPDSRRPCS